MIALPHTKSLSIKGEDAEKDGLDLSLSGPSQKLRSVILELWDALKVMDGTLSISRGLNAGSNISFEQIWSQIDCLMQTDSVKKNSSSASKDATNWVETEAYTKASLKHLPKTSEYDEVACYIHNFEGTKKKPRAICTTIEDEAESEKEHNVDSGDFNKTKKSWHLAGETSAYNRPKDSLINHDFEMEYALKNPPKPSMDLTHALEERLKDRIKNNSFDDPERKKIYSKASDLLKADASKDFESMKSTKSLSDIYAKTVESANATDTKLSQETQEELKCLAMWQTISGYLDSLSSNKGTSQPFVENIGAVHTTCVSKDREREILPRKKAASFVGHDELKPFEKKQVRKKKKSAKKGTIQ